MFYNGDIILYFAARIPCGLHPDALSIPSPFATIDIWPNFLNNWSIMSSISHLLSILVSMISFNLPSLSLLHVSKGSILHLSVSTGKAFLQTNETREYTYCNRNTGTMLKYFLEMSGNRFHGAKLDTFFGMHFPCGCYNRNFVY